MPQSKTTPSSPASSPCLCTLWTKTRQRHQADPPDTLAGRQLLSPTCHTAVAALLNGAGEREVKKLNLLTLPVFWCLGDGPTMHEEGALPGTPGRRVRALPMTDPLVSRPCRCAASEAAASSTCSGVPPSVLGAPWPPPCRRPDKKVCAEDDKVGADHMGGLRCRLGCVEAGGPRRRGLASPTRVRVWAAASGRERPTHSAVRQNKYLRPRPLRLRICTGTSDERISHWQRSYCNGWSVFFGRFSARPIDVQR